MSSYLREGTWSFIGMIAAFLLLVIPNVSNAQSLASTFSPDELVILYETNQITAKELKGTRITLVGHAFRIQSRTITFKAYTNDDISCLLRSDFEPSSLSEGQTLAVEGIVKGRGMMGNITLDDCKLVVDAEAPEFDSLKIASGANPRSPDAASSSTQVGESPASEDVFQSSRSAATNEAGETPSEVVANTSNSGAASILTVESSSSTPESGWIEPHGPIAISAILIILCAFLYGIIKYCEFIHEYYKFNWGSNRQAIVIPLLVVWVLIYANAPREYRTEIFLLLAVCMSILFILNVRDVGIWHAMPVTVISLFGWAFLIFLYGLVGTKSGNSKSSFFKPTMGNRNEGWEWDGRYLKPTMGNRNEGWEWDGRYLKPTMGNRNEGWEWDGRYLKPTMGNRNEGWEWDGRYLKPTMGNRNEGWEVDENVPVPVRAIVVLGIA